MQTLTQGLARLLLEKPIESADYDAAALLVLDAMSNTIAGLSTPQGEIIRNWTIEKPLDSGREAFVMGTLSHILEVDDLHKASVVHPGCVVVPAAWSLSRIMLRKTLQNHRISGHSLLKAVIWGYEAATRVGMAVGPAHYRLWHNTATCGPYGSAAAAGSLLSLSEAELVHAFGNAGTQSAGLWEFAETGAMSKHIHAGRAAEAGLVAAELAALGFTGPPKILEGKRGFFAAACPDADPLAVLANPDHRWQIHETSLKPWPCCRHTHPAIDAAAHLRRKMLEQGRSSGEIISISIDTYRAALNVCDKPDPATEYDAKFSLQHAVAAALAQDDVSFDAFDDKARKALVPLRSTVKLTCSDRYEEAYPARWGSAVEVTFLDGGILHEAREDALGDPENPLTRDALMAKTTALFQRGGLNDPAPFMAAILGLSSDGDLPELGMFA